MADARPFVVVGGGLAGGKAVEELRSSGYDGPLVLLAAERHLPYERPPLSKEYLRGEAEADAAFVHPAQWYAEHDVDLRLGVRVSELDTSAHAVVTDSGERLEYAKLLLAVGAQPRRLRLPGLDDAHADRVLYLRTLDDSDRLRAGLRPGARVVVVGGGWIGLEAAAAGRHAGADVTVLEMDSLPLQRVLGPEVATIFADLHRANGVDLRCGVAVSGIVAEGEGLRVQLDDGSHVDADTVLVGIGVVPDTALAEAAGLEVDDGVVTDAQLRTSDPDVFAVGDVANVLHTALGRHARVEHWAAALNQPGVAAKAMLGGSDTYDLLPYFFTDQYDLSAEYTGHVPAGSSPQVVLRPSGDAGRLAFWLDGSRVVAAMAISSEEFPAAEAIVKAGAAVDPGALADPSRPLDAVSAG